MPTPTGSRGLDRRTALRVGGGALALVLGAGAGWLDRRSDDDAGGPDAGASDATDVPAASTTTTTTTTRPPDLPTVGAVDPGIVAVGERYLASHPDDADADVLLAALPPVDGDPVAAAAVLVRDDFARGDTVVVDGWVLARSEARAAALVALACGGAAC